jgi:hypothetical protein
MGSGATAQRMAYGASLAEKQSYFETLQAERQDVESVTVQQKDRIETLVDQLGAPGQPQFVQEPLGLAAKKIQPAIVIAMVFGLLFLLSKK